MSPKKIKVNKREGPLRRIPLPFEEVISDVLKVKPEPKPARKKAKR
jgi:hypothetical protein